MKLEITFGRPQSKGACLKRISAVMHPARIIGTIILRLSLLIAVTGSIYAKEWRGISTLHSTRSDVERLLGAPVREIGYASYYSLTDEIAVIYFQEETCDSTMGKFGMGWNVPFNTVTAIGVIPKRSYKKEKFIAGEGFKPWDTNGG